MKSRIITCICAEYNKVAAFRRGRFISKLVYKIPASNCQSRLHGALLHRHRLKQHHRSQHCKDQCNCDREYPDQNFFQFTVFQFLHGTRKRFFLQFCNFRHVEQLLFFSFISSVAHIYSIRVIIACPASGSKTLFSSQARYFIILSHIPKKKKKK